MRGTLLLLLERMFGEDLGVELDFTTFRTSSSTTSPKKLKAGCSCNLKAKTSFQFNGHDAARSYSMASLSWLSPNNILVSL